MSGYPFCLAPAQFEQEVIFHAPPHEKKGGWRDVKAASMERIVEMITRIDYHDSGFIYDLVLTHRDFTTPYDFFDLLMKRNEAPPADATQEQKNKFEQEKAFIRSSTILIVRRWLPNLRASDFTTFPDFYAKILGFINSTHDDYHSELFQLLWKAKSPPTKSMPEPKALQSAASTMRIMHKPQPMASPPPLTRTNSILAFNLLSPSRSDKSLSATLNGSNDSSEGVSPSHSQYSPEQIAQELTVLDHEHYCGIHGSEFIGQAWNHNPSDAPNILIFTKWFNRVSNWIITKIVSKEAPEQRAAVIEGFISIAMNFLELKNYSGVMVVFSSLHNAAVSRLKQTWHLVSPKSIADLDLLEFLLSPAKNFKNYRKILQEVAEGTDPCIPVVGIFLADMTFMYENSSKINGMVNIDRVFLLGEKIKEFLGYQKRPYPNLHSVEQLRDSILSERVCDESECFNLSKLREDSSATPPTSASKKRISIYPAASKLKMMDLSNDEVTESANSSLSERDWQILLTGAKEKTFGSGSIIFDEGDKISYIYKIVSGKIRRRTSNSGLLSGVAVQNQLVGDTAFLNSGVSVYRAIADKDTVLMAIDVNFITKIFESDFELAATFYKTISVQLAQQYRSGVKSLCTDNPLNSSLEEDDLARLSTEDTKNIKDIVFCTKFGLPEDEVVIKVCPCKHSSISGEIYISQHYICFNGNILGLTKQKIYSLVDISRIEKVEKSLVINKLNSKKTVRKFTFKSLQELRDAHGLVSSLWKTQQAAKGNGVPSSPTAESPPGSPVNQTRNPQKSVLPTKEEWETILKGAKLQTFKKGDVIVNEGTECRKIYKILSGKCTIEKSVSITNDKREIANVLKENDLFGETTFLLGGDIHLSLIAQSDVEVHILEAPFVHALLNSRPILAPKFYRYVAHTVLKRLMSFRDKTALNTPSKSPTKPLSL